MSAKTCRSCSLFLLVAVLTLVAFQSGAGPVAVVRIINAKEVVIGEEQITIVAEARTALMTTTGKKTAAYRGSTYRGRPADRIRIYSDEATFTLRPMKGSSDPQESWAHLVNVARAIESGDRTGEIIYLNATITIEQSLLMSIDGGGFLEQTLREGDGEPGPASPPPNPVEHDGSE